MTGGRWYTGVGLNQTEAAMYVNDRGVSGWTRNNISLKVWPLENGLHLVLYKTKSYHWCGHNCYHVNNCPITMRHVTFAATVWEKKLSWSNVSWYQRDQTMMGFHMASWLALGRYKFGFGLEKHGKICSQTEIVSVYQVSTTCLMGYL